MNKEELDIDPRKLYEELGDVDEHLEKYVARIKPVAP